MIGQRHPLIVVDEAQDTGSDAWACVEMLAPFTQVMCLADLEQQIFDYLPGVGPERVAAIRDALKPLDVDLGSDNHRSPGTQIVAFGNDMLSGRLQPRPYAGVSVLPYAKDPKWNSLLRMAIGLLIRILKAKTGRSSLSIAILTPRNQSALHLSTSLNGLGKEGGKPVKHKLLFDEAEALLCARFAAYLLEPKDPKALEEDIARCLDMLADAKRATGKGKTIILDLMNYAAKVRSGTPPRCALVKSLRSVLAHLHTNPFCGDPRRDWSTLKLALRTAGARELHEVAGHLDYLVAFRRGERISSNLAAEWLRTSQYNRARDALDVALAQDQLLDGAEDPKGICVMTFHKAKGKQFDGVIVVRQAMHTKAGVMSNFLWAGDVIPYKRSRRILRVGVTRAKTHTVILNPPWPICPILGPNRVETTYQVVKAQSCDVRTAPVASR